MTLHTFSGACGFHTHVEFSVEDIAFKKTLLLLLLLFFLLLLLFLLLSPLLSLLLLPLPSFCCCFCCCLSLLDDLAFVGEASLVTGSCLSYWLFHCWALLGLSAHAGGPWLVAGSRAKAKGVPEALMTIRSNLAAEIESNFLFLIVFTLASHSTLSDHQPPPGGCIGTFPGH